MSWAITIAVVGLLAAGGKFIDDYHITEARRNSVRDALIRAFIYLDKPRVPDLANAVVRFLGRPFSGITPLRVIAVLALLWPVFYVVVVSAAYGGRLVLGPAPERYAQYVIGWLFDGVTAPWTWLLFITWFVSVNIYVTVLSVLWLLVRVGRSVTTARRVLLLGSALTVPMLAAAVSVVGALVAPLGYAAPFLAFLGMILTLPALLLAATPLVLFAIKAVTDAMQAILRTMLDASSAPRTSPFLYFSGLVGLVVLLIQVVQSMMRAG